MTRYLIDLPMMASFRVTAPDEKAALEAIYAATYDIELEISIDGPKRPIEMINVTRCGEPEVIGDDEDVDCIG